MNRAINSKLKRIAAVFLLIAGLAAFSLPAAAQGIVIRDLDKSSIYARKAISELASESIITGDSSGNFNPMQSINRAQMTAIFVRVLGLSTANTPSKATFKDVPETHWSFPYVEAAYRAGIITGISKDSFGVNELCTREQMTAIFVRALGISAEEILQTYGTSNIEGLKDKDKVSVWSKSYVEFALATGLMTGTGDKTFSPGDYALREQAAVVTHRFINNREQYLQAFAGMRELTADEMNALGKSITGLQTYDETGGSKNRGSAFAVGKGLFLTTYDLLEGAESCTITDSNGKTHAVEGIVKYDPAFNLALLKTKEPTEIPLLQMGSLQATCKADRIAVLANHNGTEITVSYGIVSGIRKFSYGENGEVDILQITAPLTDNSFGGALCNAKGKIIGIAASKSDDGNLKFAVAADHVQGWLKEINTVSFDSIDTLDMSEQIKAYMDNSDDSIKAVIYKAFRALEERDINAYMSAINPLSPAYKQTKEVINSTLMTLDVDFDIVGISILEKDYRSAELDIVYNVIPLEVNINDTIRIYGEYSLVKYDGEWKISLASEFLNQYTDADRYDTGIGAVTKEEALWAYEEAIKNSTPVSLTIETALGFAVTDSFIHPHKPVIYFSDKAAKKIIAYNYATGQKKETSLSLPPESIANAGNEIYIALLKGEHDPYLWPEEQKGAIAVLDAETLQIKTQFDIDIDPFDIVAGKDGHIYITSGSGIHSTIKCYSRTTLKEVSYSGADGGSYAALHPTKNIIYTTNNSSPRDIVMYNIDYGKFTDPVYPGGNDSPYHGDFRIGRNFIFSPDGSYLINGAGTIFSVGHGGFAYHNRIGREFTDAVFAPDGKSFFTGIKGGLVYEYTYPGFKNGNTYKVQGEIVRLYCRDGKLMAVTEAGGRYYIETLPL